MGYAEVMIIVWLSFVVMLTIHFIDADIFGTRTLLCFVLLLCILIATSPFAVSLLHDPIDAYIVQEPALSFKELVNIGYYDRLNEYYSFYSDVFLSLSIISALPGIAGIIITKAWRKKRLWAYIFCTIYLSLFSMDSDTRLGTLFAYHLIPMGSIILLEALWMPFEDEYRKKSLVQFCSLLTCLPFVLLLFVLAIKNIDLCG
jgi:hypothetical protein